MSTRAKPQIPRQPLVLPAGNVYVMILSLSRGDDCHWLLVHSRTDSLVRYHFADNHAGGMTVKAEAMPQEIYSITARDSAILAMHRVGSDEHVAERLETAAFSVYAQHEGKLATGLARNGIDCRSYVRALVCELQLVTQAAWDAHASRVQAHAEVMQGHYDDFYKEWYNSLTEPVPMTDVWTVPMHDWGQQI